MVYVACAGGVYGLSADDGSEQWRYATEMPAGHSPAVVDGVLYIGCLDKRVHAVDARTGRRLWTTLQAGAGFDTSPLVAEGKVLIGCRDGHFYAFAAADGGLAWHFRTGGPISHSAAYADGTVYFASNDGHAYALDARTGRLAWKSEKLPGDGFYGFWPVVAGPRLLVPGTNNYIPGFGIQLEKLNRQEAWPEGTKALDPIGPADKDGWIDAAGFVEYLRKHPARRTLFVLDRATGKQAEVAPILWWGNPSGNRYPPAVGPDGIGYTNTPWLWSPDFPKGRIAAWKPGTAMLLPIPDLRGGLDSNDEPEAYSIIGSEYLYMNHDSDKMGAVYRLGGGTASAWDFADLLRAFPGYCDNWKDRKYGNGNFADPARKGGQPGTHGNQNPPVPLKGRVFFHRSNAVMCFGPGGPARAARLPAAAAGGASAEAAGPAGGPPAPGRPAGAPPAAAGPAVAGPAAVTGGGPPQAGRAGLLPTVQPLQERLANQVRRMLAAGHLRPAYCICGEHYALMGRAWGDWIADYWHNPAETVCALLRALPHLPEDLRGPVRRYVQEEFTKYPPTRITHVGWRDGAPREAFPLPPEIEERLAASPTAAPGSRPPPGFQGWQFNPFSFYACWKYAAELGGAREILNEIRPRLRAMPADDVLKRMPHVLNVYIAGYMGYLGLQDLAGETRSAEVEGWLNSALAMRAAHLEIHPRELNATEAGGFLLLVPELGDWLHRNARQAVERNVRLHQGMAEYWFVSRVDEVTRYETRTAFQEGATSHYYEYSSLFSAKALALKQDGDELEKYLDVPAVAVGDLFYIQNLVSTIEALRPATRN